MGCGTVLTSALWRRTAHEDEAHLSIPSHRLLQYSRARTRPRYAGQDLLNTRHRLPAGPLGGRPRAQIDEGVRARETQARVASRRAASKRITLVMSLASVLHPTGRRRCAGSDVMTSHLRVHSI